MAHSAAQLGDGLCSRLATCHALDFARAARWAKIYWPARADKLPPAIYFSPKLPAAVLTVSTNSVAVAMVERRSTLMDMAMANIDQN